MNCFVLMQKIKEALEPALRETPFAVRCREAQALPRGEEQKAEAMRPAAVYIGSMPPTVNDALSAAPFIVIQAMDGEDGEGLETMRIALRLCVVSDDLEEGENDLHNLISLARLCLLALPEGLLSGGQFRLLPQTSGKAPWERPDEQVLPFLQAHIFTSWQTTGASGKPRPDMADYE